MTHCHPPLCCPPPITTSHQPPLPHTPKLGVPNNDSINEYERLEIFKVKKFKKIFFPNELKSPKKTTCLFIFFPLRVYYMLFFLGFSAHLGQKNSLILSLLGTPNFRWVCGGQYSAVVGGSESWWAVLIGSGWQLLVHSHATLWYNFVNVSDGRLCICLFIVTQLLPLLIR